MSVSVYVWGGCGGVDVEGCFWGAVWGWLECMCDGCPCRRLWVGGKVCLWMGVWAWLLVMGLVLGCGWVWVGL